MKNKITSTLILLFLLTITGHAQKTAFINEKALFEVLPGFKEGLKKSDSLKVTFEKEIESDKKRISTEKLLLLSSYGIKDETDLKNIDVKLSEIDKGKFQILMEETKLLDKKIEIKQFEYQSFHYQKVVKPIDDLNQLIQSYCIKNKIDLLLKLDVLSSTIAYYDKKKDISDEIIKLILKK